jgi:hypothetical protein
VFAGLILTILIVGGFIVVIRGVVRQRRDAPLVKSIHAEPVRFSTPALIRIRGDKASGWGTLKSPGGTTLLVHEDGIEAKYSPGDALLGWGYTLRSSDTTCGATVLVGLVHPWARGPASDFTVRKARPQRIVQSLPAGLRSTTSGRL